MIISFFGHADFYDNGFIKEALLNELNKIPKNIDIDFYLGGYGNFDSFAKKVCIEFKKTRNNVKLFYVTPYLAPSFLKNKQPFICDYDQIISFDCANKSGRFSIIKRNEQIIKVSSLIFFYVQRTFGGAYKALTLAKKLKKKMVNLA